MARGIKGGLESRFDPGGGDVPRLFPFKVNKGHDEHHVQTPERQGREGGESSRMKIDGTCVLYTYRHSKAPTSGIRWGPMGNIPYGLPWAPVGNILWAPRGWTKTWVPMGGPWELVGPRGTPWPPMRARPNNEKTAESTVH